MPLIDSDALPLDDELDTEEVSVPALGGDVMVRGMDLVERLRIEQRVRDLNATPGQVNDSFLELVPGVLELCVLDAKRRPVKTAGRWRAWGGKHRTEAVQLFNVAWRLSGMDIGGAEKNSEASRP